MEIASNHDPDPRNTQPVIAPFHCTTLDVTGERAHQQIPSTAE
jgi:hypothetical protein